MSKEQHILSEQQLPISFILQFATFALILNELS